MSVPIVKSSRRCSALISFLKNRFAAETSRFALSLNWRADYSLKAIAATEPVLENSILRNPGSLFTAYVELTLISLLFDFEYGRCEPVAEFGDGLDVIMPPVPPA